MNAIVLRSWQDVASILLREPVGTTLRFRKGLLVHPTRAGMTASIGLPQGQIADFRGRLLEGRGLHVKDFDSHYEAHIDAVHPAVNPIEHLRQDAPAVFVGGGAALGAAIGAAVGKSGSSAAAGAAIGGILSAIIAYADK